MADRLQIYNGALRLLGPGRLSSLAEARPERFTLDDAWDGAVAYLLKQGFWNFAIRSATLSTVATPTGAHPGYDYAFSRPADFVRTVSISSDPTFVSVFEDYEVQHTYFYTNIKPVYLRYISNDAAYGLAIANWPEDFAKALEAWLAFESGLPVSGDRGNRNDMLGLFKERLARAKTLDAVDERVNWKNPGRWSRARVTQLNRRDG